MTDPRDIVLARRQREESFEPNHPTPWGVIVSVDGSTSPTNRPNLTWVDMYNRSSGRVAVINNTTLQKASTPVQLGPDPKPPFLKIIGPYDAAHDQTEADVISRFAVPVHGDNHQIPTEADIGDDPTLIYQPALQPLKTTGNGTDLTISVQPLIYLVNGTRKEFQGDTIDLTGAVPGTSGYSRRVLIYLDKATNTAGTLEGTAVSGATPIPYPKVPAGVIPSAYVKLTNGQTAVTTATHVTDTRPLLTVDDSETSGQIVVDAYGLIVVANGEIVTA